MKIKHKCKECAEMSKKYAKMSKDDAKLSKEYAKRSKNYAEGSKEYAKWSKYCAEGSKYHSEESKKFAEECQCKEWITQRRWWRMIRKIIDVLCFGMFCFYFIPMVLLAVLWGDENGNE